MEVGLEPVMELALSIQQEQQQVMMVMQAVIILADTHLDADLLKKEVVLIRKRGKPRPTAGKDSAGRVAAWWMHGLIWNILSA